MVTDSILRNVQAVFPKDKASELFNTLERIGQRATDFIRGNPLVSTAAIGIGTSGLIATVASVAKKRRKKKTTVKRKRSRKKTSVKRKRKKRTKAEIKRVRLKNLAKARRARKRGSKGKRSKRRIIRGPGLGSREIKHSGRSTKGKFKVVKFRDKKTGKIVRFKARR